MMLSLSLKAVNDMEPIYAKCNKSCGHKFYVQHFKKDKLHNSIEKTYFNCPNCGREYVCFYTDESIRKLQAKMRELHRKMKWADGDKLAQLKQEESKLKADIKNRMDTIK
ncbi:hypothetical protein FC756_23175 [Lysinibacillus mangiferihumi]|uniref:Transglycosylase n=1 Tax=Lysinibacillus mangiferihumi TaxID=1130819 RepID=A0A4U2Y1W6_9BACI|nr:hypothetical protein [Lysinibacillus mangiferihumi]TKI53532.1 hypothetical protein FC756_23175 [Lysinibacillus mangiferihumi]